MWTGNVRWKTCLLRMFVSIGDEHLVSCLTCFHGNTDYDDVLSSRYRYMAKPGNHSCIAFYLVVKWRQ